MYSSENENQLIVTDIVSVMSDYTSIQLDIDEAKVKAAALIAQNLDIKRIIGKANLLRCIEPDGEADSTLQALVIPPLCYFTYARLCKMFPGTFTDSGYVVEEQAESRGSAKAVANEFTATAEAFLKDVIDFLKEESPQDTEVKTENLTPSIRVFGGQEFRNTTGRRIR